MADVDEVTTDIVMPGEEKEESEDMEEGEEERFFGGFFCTNYCAGPCVSVKLLIARVVKNFYFKWPSFDAIFDAIAQI